MNEKDNTRDEMFASLFRRFKGSSGGSRGARRAPGGSLLSSIQGKLGEEQG